MTSPIQRSQRILRTNLRTAAFPKALLVVGSLVAFCITTSIASPGQILTTLASFNGTNGDIPSSSLIQGIDGNLYGTTEEGGTHSGRCGDDGCGTIFKMTPQGTLTTLHSFQGYPSDGSDPGAALVLGTDGNYYGTTAGGGANCSPYPYGCGTVYKITPGGTETTLYSFCSQNDCADGKYPNGVVLATDGNFYGTTIGGGSGGNNCYPSFGGCGTVFKITPSGTLTTLYTFCTQNDCADGKYPVRMVQATDGNFYGVTTGSESSGNNCNPLLGCGTVFKLTLGGTLTTLYSFCSQSNCPDGANPSGLIQATDGNFYGTTYEGGADDVGTVFKITPQGTLTTLHSFQGYLSDGVGPGGLVQATDGNFYGSTNGGVVADGTLFKITPGGTLTTLHSFSGLDGISPDGLVQATDGNFYGTTAYGGAHDDGTVFRLSTGLNPFLITQPTSGTFETPVTILGTNLTGATSVTFNGTPATIITNTGSAITTTVPAGAATGTVQVMVGGNTLISNTDFQVVGPIQLVPVTPCRLVDTRQTGGPIQGGTSRNFIVPQLGGCDIPASAAAYSLNVTVVPNGPLGYLTIWPEGEIQPFVSTMNSPDGRTKANASIVPSGNNAVSVYVTNTTNVILDINGYFAAPGSQTYQFYPLTPCRLVDTRNGNGGPLQKGVERDYTIAGHCGIPSTATAYSFNVTVIPTNGELDYLTVWPKGQTMPYVSTLNDPTGTVVANAAIVPAGADNATAFYAHDNPTNLLLDVNGYFGPAGSGGLSLYPVEPCRVLDTRQVGNGQPFQGVYNPPNGIDVLTSPCALPSDSRAFVFNTTVVPSGVMPFLTLWPHGETQPNVSTLNAYDGFITSNMAIVPTTDGSIDAYAAGLTQLILDISGYFAP
jgi:uncharacterized repeat protein (TIGR03803 family)